MNQVTNQSNGNTLLESVSRFDQRNKDLSLLYSKKIETRFASVPPTFEIGKPVRIDLWCTGSAFRDYEGFFVTGYDTLKSLIKNANAPENNRKITIDYNHELATWMPATNYGAIGEIDPISLQIEQRDEDYFLTGEAIFFKKGVELAQSGAARGFSPALCWNAKRSIANANGPAGEEIGPCLFNIGLVSIPFNDKLREVPIPVQFNKNNKKNLSMLSQVSAISIAVQNKANHETKSKKTFSEKVSSANGATKGKEYMIDQGSLKMWLVDYLTGKLAEGQDPATVADEIVAKVALLEQEEADMKDAAPEEEQMTDNNAKRFEKKFDQLSQEIAGIKNVLAATLKNREESAPQEDDSRFVEFQNNQKAGLHAFFKNPADALRAFKSSPFEYATTVQLAKTSAPRQTLSAQGSREHQSHISASAPQATAGAFAGRVLSLDSASAAEQTELLRRGNAYAKANGIKLDKALRAFSEDPSKQLTV